MNKVTTVYEITKELDQLLSNQDHKSREELIKEINILIERRGEHMDSLVPPYTLEESELGIKIVELNNRIEKQMNTIFDTLKIEMKQVRKQKKSNNSYKNPYRDVMTMDGMFLDKRE